MASRRQFNCSSSSSYDSDDGTEVTDYTNSTGDLHYAHDSSNYQKPTRLFQEAEELLQRGMKNLFGGHITCGVPPFPTSTSKACVGKGGRRSTSLFDDDIDDGVKLDWRKDPYHSMSDWTLIIRDAGQPSHGGSHSGSSKRVNRPQTYYIHKTIVSYGQRKSGLLIKDFERHIMEQRQKGSSNRPGSTEIALSKAAAQYVPQLLDYIYFDKLDLNEQNAPSLRHLANMFDVRELYALVSSFIQSDLSSNAPTVVTTYIREAEAVKDKELVSLALSIAVNIFDSIPNDSLVTLPPHVFQQLTSNPQLNISSSLSRSIVLSQRIATYIQSRDDINSSSNGNETHTTNKAEINDEIFYFMTHNQILPEIHPQYAIFFLIYTHEKFPNVLIDDSMGGYEGTLKRRCIVAAAKNWRELLLGEIKENVRRKIDGGGEGDSINASSGVDGGSPTRRRLFVDGDDDTKLDQGKGYMSLPMDIRVELLEEALLNAAISTADAGKPSALIPNETTAGQNSIEYPGNMRTSSSSDYEKMLNTSTKITKKDKRGDNGGRRESRKPRRETRGVH